LTILVLVSVGGVLPAPRIENLAWDGRSGNQACESFVMSSLGLAEKIMESD
jgi:hypothetical protein